MRTALTHLRTWSGVAAAFATILYLTLVPHRLPVRSQGGGNMLSATLENHSTTAVTTTKGFREAVR